MPDQASPQTLKQIGDLLVASCESVREFDRQTTLGTWREWGEAFPLPPKQHRAILADTAVYRVGEVRTGLFGRRAIEAYESQSGFGVIVLCEGSLVGWSCTGKHVPRLDAVDANLIVTSIAFDWTFGLHAKWRRSLHVPVFLDREMLARAGLLDTTD